jgi:hypothetical protein
MSQELQAVDAGGGDDHLVRRISQRVAHRCHLAGDVRGEGNNPKRGIGVQLMEQLVQSGADPLSSLGQQYDFMQAGGADAYAPSAKHSVIKHPALFARQFLGIREPTDYDVGVEEKSRIQETESSIAPQRIPQIRGIEIDNISGDFDLSGQNTRGRFKRRFLRSGNRGYRPPTPGHRNRASVIVDFIE